MLVEAMRAVLRQDQYVEDAGIDAVAQRKVYDAVFSGEWHSRLGALGRQDAQATALTPCQNHGSRAHNPSLLLMRAKPFFLKNFTSGSTNTQLALSIA
jgi:hypothetical protein